MSDVFSSLFSLVKNKQYNGTMLRTGVGINTEKSSLKGSRVPNEKLKLLLNFIC